VSILATLLAELTKLEFEPQGKHQTGFTVLVTFNKARFCYLGSGSCSTTSHQKGSQTRICIVPYTLFSFRYGVR